MIRPLLSLERLSLDERTGQVTIRYFGLYANAHRGKVKKASQVPVSLGMTEEELRPIPFESSPILPHNGWRGKAHRKCAPA
jgi:hypothetical protein